METSDTPYTTADLFLVPLFSLWATSLTFQVFPSSQSWLPHSPELHSSQSLRTALVTALSVSGVEATTPSAEMFFLMQANFCEEVLASSYIHPGHFPGKEGRASVQLLWSSSLIRSALQRQRKRLRKWKVMLGGLGCGNILSFAILTIKSNSAVEPSPAFQHRMPDRYGSAVRHSFHHCSLSLRAHGLEGRSHLWPSPPLPHVASLGGGGEATKSTLASRPYGCYVKRLSWGEKQAGLHKPPRESSLSSQPGTIRSGPMWLMVVLQLKIQGFVLVTLEGGTQDHSSSLDSQPKCLFLPLKSYSFRWRRTTFYEEEG